VEYRRKVETHLIPAIGQVPLQQLTTAMLNALLPPAAGPWRRCTHGAVRARHHPQGAQRRGPLGAAGPQPRPPRRRPRDPIGQSNGPGLLTSSAASWSPLQRPAVCRLATGGPHGDAPRRGPRAALGRPGPGGRLAVGPPDPGGGRQPARVSEPKTDRGRRRIALDGETVAALRAHHTAEAAERLVAGPAWQGSDLVFTRPDGAPLHPEYVRRQLTGCSSVPGCRGFTSTTCATPTPPWPCRRACTPKWSASGWATPPWP
jgi:hypothetical protein